MTKCSIRRAHPASLPPEPRDDSLLAYPHHNLASGEGFGLGVAVRLDDGLAASLGTVGSFAWSGKATTLCRVDPAEKLIMLCFAQHLPYDQHGLFQHFTNLVYQALK